MMKPYFETENGKLYKGDCLEVMPIISSGCADLILTDPPYGTIKNAGLDGWADRDTSWDNVIDHERSQSECNRILRTGGAMVIFGQEPYTSRIITEAHGNLPFSYRMVWLKDHFANSLIAKKAPVNYTEDVCVFFKKYDTLSEHPLREYSRLIMNHIGKNLKQINSDLGHRRAEHFFYVDSTQFGLCTEDTYKSIVDRYDISKCEWFMGFEELSEIARRFARRFNLPEGAKFKPNVLRYKKDYSGFHPTQKPVELMKDLIQTYSNVGDTIIDYASGSGSTLVAAESLGRKWIGMETEEGYCEIAAKRIRDTIKTNEPYRVIDKYGGRICDKLFDLALHRPGTV